MRLWLATLLLCITVSVARGQGVNEFVNIWPDARSTALGGAMTGLADDAFAAYWNAGGLGFQRGTGFAFTGANWLPGLWPGMLLVYGSGQHCFSDFPVKGVNLTAGLNWMHLNSQYDSAWGGQTGEYIGQYASFDNALGLQAGIADERFGLGFNVKYIRGNDVKWLGPPPLPEYVIQSLVVDLGGMFRPTHSLSFGAAVTNLGANAVVDSAVGSLPPTMVHFGLAVTPVDDELWRLRVLADADQYYPSFAPGFSLGDQMFSQLHAALKSLGVEGTYKRLFSWLSVTARMGYFEDAEGGRGGIAYRSGLARRNLSIFDFFSEQRRPTARDTLSGIGICYGIGLGYKDYLRLDIGDDHSIYDFDTGNVKFSLTINDPAGFVADLRRAH